MSSETNPQVLILAPAFPAFQEVLENKFHLLKPFESELPRSEFFSQHSNSIRVLLSFPFVEVDSELIGQLPKLECIVAASTGVNHIDMAECRKRNIKVCNAGQVFSDDVADYAVGLLIDVFRGVSAADRFVRGGNWVANPDFPLGTKLGEKRIGIVGLGSIGLRVAKRLEAFGCIVQYSSRRSKPFESYKYISDVVDLAKESDVLILTCALTEETHHIINKEVMLALGKKGVIINVGRGPLIDENELVKRLIKGELGGAGLDVFENEPNVLDELLRMDNVVVSPHKAALTPECFSGTLQLAVDNLEAFFMNKPLLSPVLE